MYMWAKTCLWTPQLAYESLLPHVGMYILDALLKQMMQIIGYSISPSRRGGRCEGSCYDCYPYGLSLATNKETKPFATY